jgi:hypothetical protein
MQVNFKVIPIKPEKDVIESFEWLTDVIQSYSITEQRICLREFPRQTLKMSLSIKNSYESSILRTLLTGYDNILYGVGCWHEMSRLGYELNSGSLSIQIATRYSDYYASSYALIWESKNNYEVVKIDSLTESSLELSIDSATLSSFSKNALVMPLRVCKLSKLSVTDQKVNVSTISCEFESIESFDIDDSIFEQSFLGNPVFLSRLQLNNRIVQYEISQKVNRVDFLTGDFEIFSQKNFVQTSKPFFVKAFTRESSRSLKNLLFGLKGRLVPMWIPSWSNDLTVLNSSNENSSIVSIRNCEYSSSKFLQPDSRFLSIHLRDGSIALRQIITAVEVDSAEEHIELNEPIVSSCIVKLSFLKLFRNSSDLVSLTRTHCNMIEANVNFIEIRSTNESV